MSIDKPKHQTNALSDPIREVLEDFEALGTDRFVALMRPSPDFPEVRENVLAALVASTLGYASLDYAKRTYSEEINRLVKGDPVLSAYISAYRASKSYVEHMRRKLQTDGRPEPTAGVFTAAMVLERLPSSFFSAHFLYRMGHRFEGHAVSRLILEQIAWACAACRFDNVAAVENIEPNRAISELKRFAPEAGRLYGFLSSKTHIGFASHLEFLGIENEQNIIWYAHPRYSEFAEIMLSLADFFGLIWELSQFAYIESPEAVGMEGGNLCARADRPFLAIKAASLAAVREVEQAKEASATADGRRQGPLAWN